MGHTFYFADNVSYGAGDINNIISKVVTGGVAEVFYNGTSYNTSDLNKIASYISTYGVRTAAGNALKAVKNTTNTVKVLSGGAFMADGAYTEVDNDGVILEFVRGQKNYVYIKNNLAETNSIDFVCELTEPSGDTVPLAEIDQSGNITDVRVYCKGRLAGYQSDVNQSKIIEVPYEIKANCYGNSQTVTVDMGGLGYSRIFNITQSVTKGYNCGFGHYDISTGSYYGCYPGDSNKLKVTTDKLMINMSSTSKGDDEVSVTFAVDGSKLNCTITAIYGKGANDSSYSTFSGTLYLFLA